MCIRDRRGVGRAGDARGRARGRARANATNPSIDATTIERARATSIARVGRADGRGRKYVVDIGAASFKFVRATGRDVREEFSGDRLDALRAARNRT